MTPDATPAGKGSRPLFCGSGAWLLLALLALAACNGGGGSNGAAGADADPSAPEVQAPQALDDRFSLSEDELVALDLTANDRPGAAALDPGSIEILSPPAGTLFIERDTGVVRYQGPADYAGADGFAYRISDLNARASNRAEVALVILAVNDPPRAVDDSASTAEDSWVLIDVLGNDRDAEDGIDPTSVRVVREAAYGGAVPDPASGMVTYTPEADFNGTDSFDYLVHDRDGAISSIATVTVEVSPVADAPIARTQVLEMDENQTLVRAAPGLFEWVDNPDGGALGVEVIETTRHGTLTVEADGAITYRPVTGFFGDDRFRYRVNGGGADSNIAEVALVIAKVSEIPGCAPGPLLTVAPLAESDYDAIVPLGNLNPPDHLFPTAHQYFWIVNSDGVGAPDVVPVYFPGDAWVESIATITHTNLQPPVVEYDVNFRPCREYEGYFKHLQNLNTELRDWIDNLEAEFCNDGAETRYCLYRLEHFLSAGTQIGTGGGFDGVAAIDLGARDERLPPLQWANQSRWESIHGSAYLHTQCATDAFVPAIRSQLETRFTDDRGGTRTEPPVCGRIDHDLAGTARGVWFDARVETEPDLLLVEAPHLSLVDSNFDPARGAVALGSAFAEAVGAYTFAKAASGQIDRDFADIRADGNSYCFVLRERFSDALVGALLVRMDSDTELRAEYFDGRDCTAEPVPMLGADAVRFVR